MKKKRLKRQKQKKLTKKEREEQDLLKDIENIEKELALRNSKTMPLKKEAKENSAVKEAMESKSIKEVIKNTFRKPKPSVLVVKERKISKKKRIAKKIQRIPSGYNIKPKTGEIEKYSIVIEKMKNEISKVITGQEKVIDSLIRALLCDGHVLLEGIPGIAKTLAIKTLAVVSGCEFQRIQFTVDLLPTDITGITSYTPGKGFETIKGPIFANFLIADEINRSPSKTQSAMIEAMQERQVTIGKKTYSLPKPFFVMATENPLEQSGVYELPEAQVDRFLFKVLMDYPRYKDEEKIIEENINLKKFEEFNIKSITSPTEIMKMQELTKKVYLGPEIKKYILDIVTKTRKKDFEHGDLIEWGASPRAGIALFIASKAHALMNKRNYVIPLDVKEVVHEILRHRIILSYRARAENINSDKIINKILKEEVYLD